MTQICCYMMFDLEISLYFSSLSSKVKTKSHVEAGWPDQDLDSWIPEGT